MKTKTTQKSQNKPKAPAIQKPAKKKAAVVSLETVTADIAMEESMDAEQIALGNENPEPFAICASCGKALTEKQSMSLPRGVDGSLVYYCKNIEKCKPVKVSKQAPLNGTDLKAKAAELSAKVKTAKVKTPAAPKVPKAPTVITYAFGKEPAVKIPNQLGIILELLRAEGPLTKAAMLERLDKESGTGSEFDLKNRQPVLAIVMHYQRKAVDNGWLLMTKA